MQLQVPLYNVAMLTDGEYSRDRTRTACHVQDVNQMLNLVGFKMLSVSSSWHPLPQGA